MRKLSLEIDINLEKLVGDQKVFFEQSGNVGVFETLLNQALMSIHPQGVPISKGRTLARLQRQLDNVDKNSTVIFLEDAEFDLVKGAFTNDDAKFAPQQYRVVSSILVNIEGAQSIKAIKEG